MEAAPLWIGIDVAKEQLDIAIGAEGETWSVANNDAGIDTLLQDLRSRNCALVVLEATGGFEIAAVSAGRRRPSGQPSDPACVRFVYS